MRGFCTWTAACTQSRVFSHCSLCTSGANICTSSVWARLGLGQGSDCSTEPLETSQDIPESSVFPPSASPSPRNDDWRGTPPSLETETRQDSGQHFWASAFKAKSLNPCTGIKRPRSSTHAWKSWPMQREAAWQLSLASFSQSLQSVVLLLRSTSPHPSYKLRCSGKHQLLHGILWQDTFIPKWQAQRISPFSPGSATQTRPKSQR